MAVKSTDATRGGLPSDDNGASIIPTNADTTTVDTATVRAAQPAIALSSNSISCWDALSVDDRAICENSGMLTPGCPQSQICNRVGDTCGYVCEIPLAPKPCGDDGHIGEFKAILYHKLWTIDYGQ